MEDSASPKSKYGNKSLPTPYAAFQTPQSEEQAARKKGQKDTRVVGERSGLRHPQLENLPNLDKIDSETVSNTSDSEPLSERVPSVSLNDGLVVSWHDHYSTVPTDGPQILLAQARLPFFFFFFSSPFLLSFIYHL